MKEQLKSYEGEGRPMRVGVVDDELEIRNLMGVIYETLLNTETIFWESGRKAIKGLREAKANGNSIDLLIIDLGLPEGKKYGLVVARIASREGLVNDIIVSTGDPGLISPEEQEKFRISEVVDKARMNVRGWKDIVETRRPSTKPPQE